MSIHSSLRGADNLVGDRSVLSRVERIEQLRKDGKFDPKSSSIYGLPKVRTKFKAAGGKKAKALEDARTGALAEKGDAKGDAKAGAKPAAKPAAKGAKK